MYNWFYLLSWIILVPAIIALFRYKVLTKEFMPLAINIWLGVLAEAAASVLVVAIRNNLYAYNIFMLADFLTMLWLFDNWGAFVRHSLRVRRFFVLFFVLLWVTDNFILSSISSENIFFRMSYSLVLVLVAINQLSTIYIRNNSYLTKNPYLYICMGMIFYYSFSAFICFINSASLFKPGPALWKYTTLIYVIVNVMVNIFYAIALVWMRRKVKYI